MFVSETHLPQLLSPEAYTSAELFAREQSQLLEPAWHCIGSLSDITRQGDFFTAELLGRPLIVWRCKDGPQTFANVCAHRGCMLTHRDHGSQEKLRCQYHGWEYNEQGDTCRIPDAKSFRPLEKGGLGLARFRTETAGQLIFVCLQPEPPPLKEFLGQPYAMCEELFGPDRQAVMSWTYEVACNWKVALENTLESYHIECIHPSTFVSAPDEKSCRHEIYDEWTAFYTSHEDPRAYIRFFNNALHRLAGRPQVEYMHAHSYPGLGIVQMSLLSWFAALQPMAVDRTRIVVRAFCLRGDRPGLGGRMAFAFLSRWGRSFIKKFMSEDAGVYEPLQRGLSSTDHPSGGLISVREERIFHFQEWVRKHSDSEAALAK